MIKRLTTCMFALFATYSVGLAEEDLPRDARRLINELELGELKETIALEKKLMQKKKAMIKTIERTISKLKGAESVVVKGLARGKIKEYEAQISVSERVISMEKALDILEFNEAFHYQHPLTDYRRQRCSMTFFYNGTLYIRHEDDEKGDFEKIWQWSVNEDGKVYIKGDKTHGPMYVTKIRNREISIQWKGRINKTSRARLKN